MSESNNSNNNSNSPIPVSTTINNASSNSTSNQPSRFTVEQIINKFVTRPSERRIVGDSALIQFAEHHKNRKPK